MCRYEWMEWIWVWMRTYDWNVLDMVLFCILSICFLTFSFLFFNFNVSLSRSETKVRVSASISFLNCWNDDLLSRSTHTARFCENFSFWMMGVFFLGFIYSVFVWFSLCFDGEKKRAWGRLGVEIEGLWVWICFLIVVGWCVFVYYYCRRSSIILVGCSKSV